MKYTVLIERYALKQILKLDKKAIPVIKSAIAKTPHFSRKHI